MVHGSTIVQTLDISSGESLLAPVETLFQKYATKVREITDQRSKLELYTNGQTPVKIQDLTGWTDLLCIDRYKPSKEESTWHKITIGENRGTICVGSEEYLPIYEPDTHIIRFHGEVKYAYRLLHPSEVADGEYMRHRRLVDESNVFQFGQIKVEEFKDCAPMYEIITRSSFFNGNDFHLYSHDIILTVGDKWFK